MPLQGLSTQRQQQSAGLLPGQELGLPKRETERRPGLIEWPERPTYEESENAIDWKKVMGHCAQARLSMKEFDFVLGILGRIDEATKTKAARVYTLKYKEYEDDLMRMKEQRGVDTKAIEQGAKALENQRRYDLDLAKTAVKAGKGEREFGLKAKKEQREALAGEREFGLEVMKEERLQREGVTKPADQLSWTEKEQYKSAGKELTGLQTSLADPFSKMAGDSETKKARVGELTNLMKGLESREVGRNIEGSPDAGGADPRQAALRRVAGELRTKFPNASDEQLKEMLKLKSGAYGEGEEARRMWEKIMDELSGAQAQAGLAQLGESVGNGVMQGRGQGPQRPRWPHGVDPRYE